MTSTNLRRPREIVFPCRSTLIRLSKITNVKDLGQFYLDKVWITFDEPWRVEDVKGRSLGSERCIDEETKKYRGTLYHRKLNGQRFQIFRGKGRVRNVQLNPRHFNSMKEFLLFVGLVVGKRAYHITHIDFSWLLYKPLFSTAFLFWSIAVKNLEFNGRYNYKTDGIAVLQKGSFQGFSYGGKPRRLKAYDTDDFNTSSGRKEEHKVHGCINLEIVLDQAILKKNGVVTLDDLFATTDFLWVLKGTYFIKPSKGRFRNTDFENLQDLWIADGASEMHRQLYELTSDKDYKVLRKKYLSQLCIKEKTFKAALVELANYDYDKFKKGISQDYRKQVRSVLADMPPLFKEGHLT